MRPSALTTGLLLAAPVLSSPYVIDRAEMARLGGDRAIATSTVPPVMSPGYKMRATNLPECEPTVVPNVFGDIQNFAAATSVCSSLLAPATFTITTTTTVTLGMDSAEARTAAAPQPSFAVVDRDPSKASAACSCLIGSAGPLTITATATHTAEARRQGMSDEQQFRFMLSAMRDRGAMAVPTLDARYGKPIRHIN